MIRKSFTFEGKRYYVKGKTEAEVSERLIRRKIELEEGRKRITKNTLVEDWFSEWYETYKSPAVSAGWAKTVKTIARSVILPDIGRLRLRDVKPLHLQRILNDKADMSQSYLRIIRIIMGEIFQAAVDNGLLLEDPSKGITTPKGRKPQRRRAITEKERFYILRTCERHRAGLFYKIMLYCGLRPAEVAALQWRNVDLKNRVLTVDRAIKSDGSIGPPKSDAGFRKVPIPEVLVSDLEKAQGNPFDLVCTNAHGGQLTKTSIKQQWKSFRHQLNIEMGCKTFKGGLVPPYPVAEDLVPYCLRHTYCTDLQAAGIPINVARELMGHSDISITAKIYTHSSVESFSDAAAAIENLQRRRNDEGVPLSVTLGL
jgi:integrase